MIEGVLGKKIDKELWDLINSLIIKVNQHYKLEMDVLEMDLETKVKPIIQNDLLFAFVIVKHVKSNAIVVVKNGQLLGVGAGQMSRIDAVKIALGKAGKKAKGAIVASDAFFPFNDSINLMAEYDIKAIVQPGGSVRDQESIDAANKHNMTMVFTGKRCFLH